uniref:NADH-ubiquinone oxidoreductase chain 2 n=1 Tax=Geotrypetes seraphini TaxID=260995 RepID=C8UZS1_GEOSA|nr:NADH dehydrogenase subunit 2 [Geotrypetes seraphini]AAX58649.1 NADH dehydrogenase subunit 2 [Geotrypetes seraphini]
MNPFALAILLISMFIGTMVTLTSSHWLLAWLGLEISTLAIIPLMITDHHPRATEATTKYFLTQATAATLILFSALINAWNTGMWELKELSPLSSNMLSLALMMKMGLAPLHFWLPEVLQGLSLTTGLILSTWQKIAPIALMYMIFSSLNIQVLMIMGLLSIIVGGWIGLNQVHLRKVIAASSIAHLGWMMIILPFSPHIMMLTFLIYILMTTAMFLSFKIFNATQIKMLTIAWTKMPVLVALMMFILLSLGGLPPTTGFLPKWFILQELTLQHIPSIATVMAISSLLSLFFYLRLTYALTLTYSPNTVNSTIMWRFKFNNMFYLPLMVVMVLATFLLPLTPSLISF